MWATENFWKHIGIQRPKIHQKQTFFSHGPKSLLTSVISIEICGKSFVHLELKTKSSLQVQAVVW